MREGKNGRNYERDTLSLAQPCYYCHTIKQQNHIQKGDYPSGIQRASLGSTGEDSPFHMISSLR